MRRLRMAGCVLSLALCGALVFLWGRSTTGADHVFYGVCRDDRNVQRISLYSGVSRAGSIGLWVCRYPKPAEQQGPAHFWNWSEADRDNGVFPPLNRFGFAVGILDRSSATKRQMDYVAMVPYWLLVALTAAAPFRALVRFRRRCTRACRGLCVSCGYDLRGTPGRCPECGAAPLRIPEAAG